MRSVSLSKEESVADINVERKGPSIWPWIIGLIVLALLIWALVELFGGEDEAALDPIGQDTVTAVQPTTAAPTTTALPIAQIRQSPETYQGQTVSGEAQVVGVESDRAFWVEEQGQRLLVLVRGAQGVQPPVAEGQRVHLANATVLTAAELDQAAADLDAGVRQTATGEDVLLAVEAGSVHPAQAQPAAPIDTAARTGTGY